MNGPSGAEVFAAVVGPDLEGCPIDTEPIAINPGIGADEPDERLRFALFYATRLRWLGHWRTTCGSSVHEQRQQLGRLFDTLFQASSTGRFTAFERGREERRRRWATHAARRMVDRFDEWQLPATEAFNERARQRVAAMRALLDEAI
jgi:hypothetical protein